MFQGALENKRLTSDCLWARKPSRYVTSRLGQLSLSSLQGR